jgi:hypothetical protein
MRCQFIDPGFLCELTDDMPDNLLSHALTPDPSGPIHATKDPARGESRCIQPVIENQLDPVRHRQCPRVTGLSHEIDDDPVLFALLKMGEVQLNGFVPPQAAGEQHSQHSSVTLAFQPLSIGRLPEPLALFGS